MRFCLLTATPQRRQGHLLADPRKLVPFALQGGPLLTAACGILDLTPAIRASFPDVCNTRSPQTESQSGFSRVLCAVIVIAES